jgi:DNA-binding NtrC family response regulator
MSTRTPTALIIDDNASWLRTLSRLHNEAGYEIFTAVNFNDASKKADKIKPDLIVTDIRLVDEDHANIDGIRLLTNLKNQGKLNKSIVITGYSDPSKREAADKIGSLYFEKGSFTRKDFVDTINKIYQEVSNLHSGNSLYGAETASCLLKSLKKYIFSSFPWHTVKSRI